MITDYHLWIYTKARDKFPRGSAVGSKPVVANRIRHGHLSNEFIILMSWVEKSKKYSEIFHYFNPGPMF